MKSFKPPRRDAVPAHLVRLVIFCSCLVLISSMIASAQTDDPAGLHWHNSGFTIQSNASSEQKSIKLGRALSFNQSNIGQNLLHGMQFIVAPGQAAQRERMNLYSLDELGKIWPDVRKVLKDSEVKATLVTPSEPNKFVGVPVKWNSAFATTMGGAFLGAEIEPTADLPTAVASTLIADGIISGQPLSINAARTSTKVSITGSEPSEALRSLSKSMKAAAIEVPSKSTGNRTAYVGFNVQLDKAFDEYRKINPGFVAQAPRSMTQIISTRELDGSRLNGWHEWVTE